MDELEHVSLTVGGCGLDVQDCEESMTLPMEKRTLGRTAFEVTRLGLGTYRFTSEFNIPRADSLALLECAVGLGINYMDTAPSYGNGESEELIGRVLRNYPEKRIFISSKVGQLQRSIVPYAGKEAYVNEDRIRRVVDHSLWLLQRDYLDMLFIHEPEEEVWCWDDGLDAPVLRVFEKLRDEGVIHAIGLGSNSAFFPSRLAETGRFDVIEIANGYTLLQQPIAERLLPAAARHNIGIVAGGPFCNGMLAKIQDEVLDRIERENKFGGLLNEHTVPMLRDFYNLSADTGVPIGELAIRYVISNPAIHTVIPGAQNPSEVAANYQAVIKGSLPEDILLEICRIQEKHS